MLLLNASGKFKSEIKTLPRLPLSENNNKKKVQEFVVAKVWRKGYYWSIKWNLLV